MSSPVDIRLRPEVATWLATSSQLAFGRFHQWTIDQRNTDGDYLNDSIDVLISEAVAAGVILCPDGWDMWMEYTSAGTFQVFVSIQPPHTDTAPTVLVSPVQELSRVYCSERGVVAAVHALVVIIDIANNVTAPLHSLAPILLARASADPAILTALVASNNKDVHQHVLDNPHTPEDIKTAAWLLASND